MTHRQKPHRGLGRAGQGVPTYVNICRGQADRNDRHPVLARFAYLSQTGSASSELEDRTGRRTSRTSTDLVGAGRGDPADRGPS